MKVGCAWPLVALVVVVAAYVVWAPLTDAEVSGLARDTALCAAGWMLEPSASTGACVNV
jgi:hypothetical protein